MKSFRSLSPEEKRKKTIGRYTRPVIRYRYNRVSFQDYMQDKYDGYKTIRSSFIPYVAHQNKIYWVLGSFHDYPREILMDFGGGCLTANVSGGKKTENPQIYSPFDCAMKELTEESKGLLTPVVEEHLKQMTRHNIYVGKNYKTKQKMYFFFVPLGYEQVKRVINRFNNASPKYRGEKLGPLDIYPETSLLNKELLTSYNLSDFIDFLSHKN